MRMAEVRLQEGESLENALRRFKRKVMTEDIIKDVKRHSFYLKPGERRRVKQALAQKRARKKIRKDSDQVAQGEPLLPSSDIQGPDLPLHSERTESLRRKLSNVSHHLQQLDCHRHRAAQPLSRRMTNPHREGHLQTVELASPSSKR